MLSPPHHGIARSRGPSPGPFCDTHEVLVPQMPFPMASSGCMMDCTPNMHTHMQVQSCCSRESLVAQEDLQIQRPHSNQIPDKYREPMATRRGDFAPPGGGLFQMFARSRLAGAARSVSEEQQYFPPVTRQCNPAVTRQCSIASSSSVSRQCSASRSPSVARQFSHAGVGAAATRQSSCSSSVRSPLVSRRPLVEVHVETVAQEEDRETSQKACVVSTFECSPLHIHEEQSAFISSESAQTPGVKMVLGASPTSGDSLLEGRPSKLFADYRINQQQMEVGAEMEGISSLSAPQPEKGDQLGHQHQSILEVPPLPGFNEPLLPCQGSAEVQCQRSCQAANDPVSKALVGAASMEELQALRTRLANIATPARAGVDVSQQDQLSLSDAASGEPRQARSGAVEWRKLRERLRAIAAGSNPLSLDNSSIETSTSDAGGRMQHISQQEQLLKVTSEKNEIKAPYGLPTMPRDDCFDLPVDSHVLDQGGSSQSEYEGEREDVQMAGLGLVGQDGAARLLWLTAHCGPSRPHLPPKNRPQASHHQSTQMCENEVDKHSCVKAAGVALESPHSPLARHSPRLLVQHQSPRVPVVPWSPVDSLRSLLLSEQQPMLPQPQLSWRSVGKAGESSKGGKDNDCGNLCQEDVVQELERTVAQKHSVLTGTVQLSSCNSEVSSAPTSHRCSSTAGPSGSEATLSSIHGSVRECHLSALRSSSGSGPVPSSQADTLISQTVLQLEAAPSQPKEAILPTRSGPPVGLRKHVQDNALDKQTNADGRPHAHPCKQKNSK